MTALLTPAALDEMQARCQFALEECDPDDRPPVSWWDVSELLSHAAAQAERIAALEHEVDKRECWIVVRKAQDAMAPDTQARIARLRAVAVDLQTAINDEALRITIEGESGARPFASLAALQPGDMP